MCDNQDGSRQVQALLDSATPQEVCLTPDTAIPSTIRHLCLLTALQHSNEEPFTVALFALSAQHCLLSTSSSLLVL